MEFDNSWRAVFNPGDASEFFSPPPAEPPAGVREYRPTNAWWLAELSRLIYHGGAAARVRALASVDLRESRFFDMEGTQCAIVEPLGEPAGRPAILVFRGTDGPRDWRTNVKTGLVSWEPGGRVHAGFKTALNDVWQELDEALAAQAAPLLYTGHSLGGALATLAAGRRPPLAVYTFGAPRIGDEAFARTLAEQAVYRVVNRKDAVPSSPPNVGPLRFAHTGKSCPICVGRPDPGQQFPPLPGARRWYDPPGHLCDHAPVNYVACLERLARV